jgi:predicted transcriptional regulator
MTDTNKLRPVAFNPSGYASKRRNKDAKFAALAALLKARADAGLTQAEVATRMGVSQPVVARIESSLGKKDHSPSLNTLRRYADACGMKLVIRMVAQ